MGPILVPFYSFFLNPGFNCSKSFVSFSFDNVTTGTYSFVSFILNVVPDGGTIGGLRTAFTDISAKTQFFDHVKINSVSQLINGMSKCLQKLPKCFNGITTSASVSESLSFVVFPIMLVLYLNDSDLLFSGSLGSSL